MMINYNRYDITKSMSNEQDKVSDAGNLNELLENAYMSAARDLRKKLKMMLMQCIERSDSVKMGGGPI